MGFRNGYESNDRPAKQVVNTKAPVSAFLDNKRTIPFTPEHFRNPRASAFLSWEKGLFNIKKRPVNFVTGYLVFVPKLYHRIPLFDNPKLSPQNAQNLKIFDYQDTVEGVRAYFSTCPINDNPGNWKFELWGFFQPLQTTGSTPFPTKMFTSNPYYLEIDLGRCADW